MNERAVIDTGPIIALLRPRESSHKPCVDVLTKLHSPVLTCLPVITEAAYLLRNDAGGCLALKDLVSSGALTIAEISQDELPTIFDYMIQYQSIKAQFADCALIRIAEREGIETIFSLDRRDFSIYRFSDGRAPRIIPEVCSA